VTVRVRVEDARAVVQIADDGRGGADPAGSGLRGLADRVEALSGRLTVTSRAGKGTTLRAEIRRAGRTCRPPRPAGWDAECGARSRRS
jgi:signal transduction histidine kinase